MVSGRFFAIGGIIPTVSIAAYYIWAGVRCRTWREELINNDKATHRLITAEDARWVRRVTNTATTAQSTAGNPGVRTYPLMLTAAESDMLFDEVRVLIAMHGARLGEKRRQQLLLAGATEREVDSVRTLSDRAEDFEMLPIAPWGCGDGIREDRLPPVLRQLTRKVRGIHSNCGRLRHVHIDYTTQGCQIKVPASASKFDGMEFVMFSLGVDRVLTLCPRQQSLRAGESVADVSWTDFDLDVYLPQRNMVQIAGVARFLQYMGARPGKVPGTQSFGCSHAKDDEVPLPKEHALLELHFEGPTGEEKNRKTWQRPEFVAFGNLPKCEDFAPWEPMPQPSSGDVLNKGMFNFFFGEYIMLRRSF